MNSYYNDWSFSKEQLTAEEHRIWIGGIWEEQSNLQLNICKKYGLTSESKLLDFGCGCLRGGVKFIDFLNPGNYFGIDINQGLLHAGLNYEVPKANLQHKIVLENFLVSNKFDLDYFNTKFDIILAQSVFNHLPLNHLDYFTKKALKVMNGDSKIIMSFYFIEEHEDLTEDKLFIAENFSIITSYIFDTYHYKFSQIQTMLSNDWNITLLNDYHPRKQKFIMLTKKT